jgi:roadblock/LC7 domain-containing protein
MSSRVYGIQNFRNAIPQKNICSCFQLSALIFILVLLACACASSSARLGIKDIAGIRQDKAAISEGQQSADSAAFRNESIVTVEKTVYYYPKDHIMFLEGLSDPRFGSRASAISLGILDGLGAGSIGGILVGGVASLLSKDPAFKNWSLGSAAILVPIMVIDNLLHIRSKTAVRYGGEWVDPAQKQLMKIDSRWEVPAKNEKENKEIPKIKAQVDFPSTTLSSKSEKKQLQRETHIVRHVSETLICKIDYARSMDSLVASPDGKHVAQLLIKGDGYGCIAFDGKEGKIYQGATRDGLSFSPDSSQLAYYAQQDGKWFVVVNGVEGKNRYKNGFFGKIIYSKNSQHMACFAITETQNNEGQKTVAVIDGKEGKEYDLIWVEYFRFSNDGEHHAYPARRNNKWFVVIDGQEQPEYDSAGGSFSFSPDGHHYAYEVKINGKKAIVRDGIIGKQYDQIFKQNAYSPDGRHFSYYAQMGNKQLVVVDDMEQALFDGILRTGPVFSPSGNHLAYGAIVGSKWLVVLDGQEGKRYDGITPPVFSPDGKILAYGAKEDNACCIVINGSEDKSRYDFIYDEITFSADSKRMAYPAKSGVNQLIILDRMEGNKYRFMGGGNPVFSPTGKHIAYVSSDEDNKMFVVLDDLKGNRYDAVGIIAGTETGNRIYFETDEAFHYLAVKGDMVYFVEEKISIRRVNG